MKSNNNFSINIDPTPTHETQLITLLNVVFIQLIKQRQIPILITLAFHTVYMLNSKVGPVIGRNNGMKIWNIWSCILPSKVNCLMMMIKFWIAEESRLSATFSQVFTWQPTFSCYAMHNLLPCIHFNTSLWPFRIFPHLSPPPTIILD